MSNNLYFLKHLNFFRLGTASMLSEPGGPFIQLSRLNISKHASDLTVAKPLFEYIFYHERDPTIVSLFIILIMQ